LQQYYISRETIVVVFMDSTQENCSYHPHVKYIQTIIIETNVVVPKADDKRRYRDKIIPWRKSNEAAVCHRQ